MPVDALAGLVTGVLSGWGIGGGTLLTLYMAAFRGMAQQMAQGINLLYFLPCAAGSSVGHIQHKQIHWQAVRYTLAAGLLTSCASAWLAQNLDDALLRRLFGVLLLLVGALETFHRSDSK